MDLVSIDNDQEEEAKKQIGCVSLNTETEQDYELVLKGGVAMADDRIALVASLGDRKFESGRRRSFRTDSLILYFRVQKGLDGWTFTYETTQFIKPYLYGSYLVKRINDILIVSGCGIVVSISTTEQLEGD